MFDRSFLPQADLEFVLIADTHYMLDPGEREVEFESRRLQSARAEQVLNRVSALRGAFVVHLGDLVQEYPETERYKQALAEVQEQLGRCGLQPYHVAGNHDLGDKPDPTMPTNWVTPESLAAFQARFGPSWYSWDAAGLHFVVLNSQILNADLPEADAQQRWLEADLRANSGRRIFLFLHLALFLKEENEPSLGHYDNIAEPARGWLIDLIRRNRIELVFSAHSHFAFFNRIDQTRYFNVVSTSFTRPGFSELFSSGPPPEQGRDDAQKLGFYLIRVGEAKTDVHFIRTYGETRAVENPAVRQLLVTRISGNLPGSPVGMVLHRQLAEIVDIPLAYPSIVRQPIRNDYPFLSCTELALGRVRVPASDLTDPLQSRRLSYLRDEGVDITASWLWHEPVDLLDLVKPFRQQLDGLELQLLGALQPTELCLRQIKQCMAELNLPLTLTPVIPRERIQGKQHFRTRLGYRVAELAELDRSLAQADMRLDRALCRVAANTSPWDAIRPGPALPDLSHIEAIDWAVEFATVDERRQANRTAEAILAIAAAAGSQLFLEPLVDLDRTMDVTYGLLDRMCNPRPAFQIVRCLNTILFSKKELWQRGPAQMINEVKVLHLACQGKWLWLLLPEAETEQQIKIRGLKGLPDNLARLKLLYLEHGLSQSLPVDMVNTLPAVRLDQPTLVVAEKD